MRCTYAIVDGAIAAFVTLAIWNLLPDSEKEMEKIITAVLTAILTSAFLLATIFGWIPPVFTLLVFLFSVLTAVTIYVFVEGTGLGVTIVLIADVLIGAGAFKISGIMVLPTLVIGIVLGFLWLAAILSK